MHIYLRVASSIELAAWVVEVLAVGISGVPLEAGMNIASLLLCVCGPWYGCAGFMGFAIGVVVWLKEGTSWS